MSTNDKLFERLETTTNMSVFKQIEQIVAVDFPENVSNGIGNR